MSDAESLTIVHCPHIVHDICVLPDNHEGLCVTPAMARSRRLAEAEALLRDARRSWLVGMAIADRIDAFLAEGKDV